MPRRFLLAPAAALLAIALVACAGSAATSSPSSGADASVAPTTRAASSADLGGVFDDKAPGTDLDACAIVAATDVVTATKIEDVAAGKLEKKPTTLSPRRSTCTYEGNFGRILVELTPEDGENLYHAARDSYADASDIIGIGDAAFNSKRNNRAFVVKGNVSVMLTMFLSGELEQLPVATELVASVVAKL
jgi:hypothetical protein